MEKDEEEEEEDHTCVDNDIIAIGPHDSQAG